MKRKLNKLDLNLYSEMIDNGLHIYVIPKKTRNIYATFTTKYGSMINEFIPTHKKDYQKYPDGIAHFLEHKVFEQKDGEDPFAFYEKRGASSNASTTTDRTTYLFSGTEKFKENLNYLLDFVQSPYFTEENVEKEKGIIKEELDMYEDDPYTVLYDKSLFNTFKKHPIRISVGGTKQSIKKITKDMLYECYNTFYHPSNMFLIVTGNVNPKEVFEIVKENQSQKDFKKMDKIKIKNPMEPDEVYKEKEHISFDVVKPKVSFNIKINIENLDYSLFEIRNYLFYYFDLKLGVTSEFSEKLKQDGIIHYDIGINMVQTDRHIAILLLAETDKPNEFIDRVKKEIQNKEILEKDFERKKKALISSYIMVGDSIYSLNSKVMNNIIRYNEVYTDDFSMIKKLNTKDANNLLKQVDFKNTSSIIMKKEK